MTDQPTKKPIVVVCIADKNNYGYAVGMINSLRKFHDWPVVLVTDETNTKDLPKGVETVDLTQYTSTDPAFFYRATPILAEKYLKEYECVLKIDADSIITGDLSYIEKTKDYDVATVINYNKPDAEMYGAIGGYAVAPVEYFNCGFVVLRSEKFAHHWTVVCFSEQFNRLQYREQDLLNVLCYFGNYGVRCLDHFDPIANMRAWWGLFAKTYWNQAVMRDGKIIIPQQDGDPILDGDTELKVIHVAGGNVPNKMSGLRKYFNDEVGDYLDSLISPTK